MLVQMDLRTRGVLEAYKTSVVGGLASLSPTMSQRHHLVSLYMVDRGTKIVYNLTMDII